jgi:hypothetical protein
MSAGAASHGCKLGPLDCDTCAEALALPWARACELARFDAPASASAAPPTLGWIHVGARADYGPRRDAVVASEPFAARDGTWVVLLRGVEGPVACGALVPAERVGGL